MIKKLLSIGMLMGISAIGMSQTTIDTLVNENFNSMALPTGWSNISEDTLVPATGTGTTEKAWFFGDAATNGSDSSAVVAKSTSWMTGFAPGNRNWLITGGVTISGTNASLNWKSAPGQVGLYMDGYKVLVSTTDISFTSFTDTIAVYAQNTNDDPTSFSTGMMHVENDPNPDTTAGFDFGKLSQWQLSLDAYNGQTIFVAFLHDSDDDFFISIDDVLITEETTLIGVNDHSGSVNIKVFPNPTSELVHVEYEVATSGNFDIRIVSIDGKVVYSENLGSTSLINTSIDVSELPAGTYFVQLRNENQTNIQKFTVTK